MRCGKSTTVRSGKWVRRLPDDGAIIGFTSAGIFVAGHPGIPALSHIVNYLKRMLGDERHDVLFVGYQAEGTPGRDIQRHGPRGGWVQLDGERIDIRVGIHTIGGYSAHADQNNLLAFIQGIPQAPKEIRLIHGEHDAQEALKTEIKTWAEASGHAVEVTLAA